MPQQCSLQHRSTHCQCTLPLLTPGRHRGNPPVSFRGKPTVPKPENKNILFRKAVSIPLLYPFLLNLYGFSPGITRLIDMRSAAHGAVKKQPSI